MLVKGNSGFGVALVDETTVRKSAKGATARRLKRQIDKQIFFYDAIPDPRIRTPRVLTTETGEDSFHADMEFIAAKDFVQFLSEASRESLEGFLSLIVAFIRHNLAHSAIADVAEKINAKLAELAGNNVPEKYIEAAANLCKGPVEVPVGPCHGDLTLSNILFKGDSLYFLDFLDCYVESPLQDIAKLRQDTFFGWSLQLYQAEFNAAKIQIALRYLDQRLVAAFTAEPWYQQHYDLFQLVNLMRVLPYCKNAGTTDLITGGLDRMPGDLQAR